jgi:putative endonuclease
VKKLKMTNQELGAFGENYAAQFLSNQGFEIIERNYRHKHLEIDIIALNTNQIVAIEVKTRQTAEIGEPWRAVTKAKQKLVIKAFNYYLQDNEIETEARFDVISIVHNGFRTDLEHIKDAFYPGI